MLKAVLRVLFCAILTTGSVGELRAQTILSVSGGGWDFDGASLEESTGDTVSWTQTNGFTNVTITAKLGGVLGIPAVGSGRAFLTRRVGPGTTTNDELASVTFPFPAEATNVVLFTGLTLEPGTWFLTITGSPGASAATWLVGCRAEFAYADGVTMGTAYAFYEATPYPPATDNRDSGTVFFHFSVIAGTNGLPEERPRTPFELNRGPVTREQSFTVRENEPLTFRFDAFDPDGDPFEISINYLGIARLTAEGFGGSLAYLTCFPPTEVTYTFEGVGDEVIEYVAGDHGAHSYNRVLIKVLPPALTISCTNGTVELQWAARSPYWQVMFANSPEVMDWELLDIAPVVEGDKLVVRAPASTSPRFFRLQRPY